METPRCAGIYANLTDMSRLLLFSGGVESTAMMTIKNPEDPVITIQDISPGEEATFNRLAVQNIAAAMNFDVEFCTFHIPFQRPKRSWNYQMWYFLPIAGLRIIKDRRITELWYGGEKAGSEPPFTEGVTSLDEPNKKYKRLKAAWDTMFPHVPLVFPLEQYTKQEQWAFIPDHVKPLVRTCVTNIHPTEDKNCGICRKCQELKLLPGSCLYKIPHS